MPGAVLDRAQDRVAALLQPGPRDALAPPPAVEAERIDPRERIRDVGVQVHASRQPDGVLADVAPGLRVVVPEPVVIEARLLVLVLPRPAPRASRARDVHPRGPVDVELRLPRERPGLVRHHPRRPEVVAHDAVPALPLDLAE